MLPGHQSAAGDLGQQRRERLRLGLQGCQTSRLGLAELGVVLQRALVYRKKIRCRRRGGTRAQYKQGQQSLHGLSNAGVWGYIVLYITISPMSQGFPRRVNIV